MIKIHRAILMATALVLCNQMAAAEPLRMRNSAHGYQYVTAGIGEEEAAQMKRIAKNYTLNLLFSEGVVGRWATNINVNIYGEDSKLMFRIIGAQPVLYVNLPAGTYTILANNNGNKLRHKVTLIEGENHKVILNWKDFVDEDVPLDGEGN